jgi:pyrroloquinoline quinone (PQQ) biosynthesis protein C
MTTAKDFLARLRVEIETHPAVNHIFLNRCATSPFSREDYRIFGENHYPLVCVFTSYLERLLCRAPSSDAKLWLAKVLVDEYGEGSDGKDHTTLYREYLLAAGATEAELMQTPLHQDVTGFVREHLRMSTAEPFLVGLGAVGPGHEWSIPHMFPRIVAGLSRAGFTDAEIDYFRLHMLQDEDHGAWLEEALALYADTRPKQEQIRTGALRSLAARARFWSGVQRKIVRWRQPANVHVRSQATRGRYAERKEITLEVFRRELVGTKMLLAAG